MKIINEEEIIKKYREGERDFSGIELDDKTYNFQSIELEGVDFSNSYITANFKDSKLKNAKFNNSNIKTCDFQNADLTNTDFRNTLLESTEFTGAILNGANFENARNYAYVMKKGEIPNW